MWRFGMAHALTYSTDLVGHLKQQQTIKTEVAPMSAGPVETPSMRLSMFDLDLAPQSPGLYAWYVHPQIPIPIWDSADDDEGAAATFIDALQRYALVHEPPAIELRGTSAYDARWEGKIQMDYPFSTFNGLVQDAHVLDEASNTPHAEDSTGHSLFRVAHCRTKRDILARVLTQAIPIFSTPLYIGIATDLRQRLTRHKSDFTRIGDYLRNRPDERQKAIKQAKSFGHRAAARQVAMEDLEVWVLDLTTPLKSGMSADDIKDITHSAEWYLHKLFAPILGRR